MPELIERARTHVSDPDRRDEVRVTYRVHGGAPDERLEERVEFEGRGRMRVEVRDDINPNRTGEAAGDVDVDDLERLLDALAEAGEELVTREDASFPPDSLVGWVEIDVGGETETYYFDADAVHERMSGTPGERAPEDAETPLEAVTARVERLAARTMGGKDARS